MKYEEILQINPYSLNKDDKEKLLTKRLLELTEHHNNSCPEYSNMIKTLGYSKDTIKTYYDIPFIPVRLFKELSLKSIHDDQIVKTMTSSGTTGQSVSKIFLDKNTSSNQQKTMVKIVNNFTGSSRMPMIIIDCPSVIKDRTKFSARGAGILGFSMFGSKIIYALDDDMKLDVSCIREFLENYKDQTILMFGFTFMIWQHFYKELIRLKNNGVTLDFSNAVLIHGGGWKKLSSEAVSQEEFHQKLKEICGLDRIHDYYGMVEQTGCIYMQCECGHLHASIFSDVIARRPIDFSICDYGEPGILQVVSTIPESYPGHSLLTEDEGIVLGEDDCPCGRLGKYFKINGRIAKAEIRGCSDTYAADKFSDCHTEQYKDNIQYLIGNKQILENMSVLAPRSPFDEEILSFIEEVSKKLISDTDARSYPDVVTLGFWLRKSSILNMKMKYYDSLDLSSRLIVGRGVAFHIAPSNVAVNYAYSLFTGLLCGNANVVRIPSKDFPQVSIINRIINAALSEKKYNKIIPYICLIKYERNKDINDYVSSLCDVRIIWGGDKTIEEIRKSPIHSRAKDITFADRYSLAIVDSDYYFNIENKDKVALDFYNDTYLSDQNACTSPRLIVWTGNKIEQTKQDFWNRLHEMLKKRYHFQTIQGVDKLSNVCLAAAGSGNISPINLIKKADNYIYRIKTSCLDSKLMDYRGNSGFFYEYDCNNILELKDICSNVHCQTLIVVGNSNIVIPLIKMNVKGVDRVALVGHSMDFDLMWDGYNLLFELTRSVSV